MKNEKKGQLVKIRKRRQTLKQENNQSKKSLRKGKKATKTQNQATGKIGKNTKN